MVSKSSAKDFEVLNKIGQGSFGTVFKVRRKLDKNFYVMKTINISQMDRRGQQESINEVKILASLDSPYIVKYFDSFIENKTLHIIMEYCDKGDLSQAIRSQMGRLLPETKIWRYFIQMCLGLEFVHSKKILHRDIKSMNVFLIRDDIVRIGDLGVAKVLANTAAFAHTMVGTPYYLSPELCEEKPYNVKSDVWALGCVLYELCTLKHPFDALNQAALLLKIIKGNYIPISTSYSSELKEIVDLSLCKDYRKRPTISGILNRPGIKERTLGLNIAIPQTSVLAGIGISIQKEPALIYQSQMAVIEEEKVSKVIKPNNIKSSSPGPNKNIAKKEQRPSEHEMKKPVEQDFKQKVKPLEKPVLANKSPASVDKPKESRSADFKEIKVPEHREVKQFDQKEFKIVEKDQKDPKKLPVKPPEVKEKEPVEMKPQPKPRSSNELVPHYNNIQLDLPQKAVAEQKAKQSNFKVSPRNMAQKLEVKAQAKNEALKVAANKIPAKPAVRVENKQKIVRPGIQAPHFMPPQRPQDLKNPKKEQEPEKVNEEVKSVQQLPDYPKPKKLSIDMFKPVLLKFEAKTFEILQKPIFDDVPYIFEQFAETIDWNFTQTGFTGKDFIPFATHTKPEPHEFQVNYAKTRSVSSQSSDEENDDELYHVSDSESSNEGYKNEEFEEINEEDTNSDMYEKLKKLEKELIDVKKLEEIRRREIIDRVGKETFIEMYEFFKAKANSEEDINEDEQREIENFMYTRVSIENTDICIIISKLFHNESERRRLEGEIAVLQAEIEECN